MRFLLAVFFFLNVSFAYTTYSHVTIPELIELAESGDVDAQYQLGVRYYDGIGVNMNWKLAADYFSLAADQGDPISQYNLGWMFHSGHGVELDYEKAAKYFLLAAEQGLVRAQFRLGLIYSSGIGVKKISERACDIINKR